MTVEVATERWHEYTTGFELKPYIEPPVTFSLHKCSDDSRNLVLCFLELCFSTRFVPSMAYQTRHSMQESRISQMQQTGN